MKSFVFLFIFLFIFQATTTAFAKSVNLTMNARVSTCPKNAPCEFLDSSHNLVVPLAPLGNSGLDLGIADLDYVSPIQKFNFKMVASIHETETSMELLFAAFDQEYRLNKVLIKMPIPHISEVRLKLESPLVTDSRGTTSKLILEILKTETVK